MACLLLIFTLSMARNRISRKSLVELTDDQVEEVESLFTVFDKDGDGQITAAELGEVLKTVGETPEQAELLEMIQEIDTTDSGTISYDEFFDMVVKVRQSTPLTPEETTKTYFQFFDQDNDGYITKSELKQALTGLGEKLTDGDVAEILGEVDVDGDGRISYEEFAKVMSE